MPGYAIFFGLLLTALGVTAYVSPDTLGGGKQYQISALSPAFMGIPILIAGVISPLAVPNARKHAMHATAAVLLGYSAAQSAASSRRSCGSLRLQPR